MTRSDRIIYNLKSSLAARTRTAYSCAADIYNGKRDRKTIEELTGSIRDIMTASSLLEPLTGNSFLNREIHLLQRILNICQVLTQTFNITAFFENKSYDMRKSALRSALFIENDFRDELQARLRKLPYQLKKSMTPDRKSIIEKGLKILPDTPSDSFNANINVLNQLLPLVLIQSVDMHRLSMKLAPELLPEMMQLESFLTVTGVDFDAAAECLDIVRKISAHIRQVEVIDVIFSSVKRILLEDRELTVTVLKTPVYRQHEEIRSWEKILNLISARNDKGLIKLMTQIIRERHTAADELTECRLELADKKIWDLLYRELSQNTF